MTYRLLSDVNIKYNVLYIIEMGGWDPNKYIFWHISEGGGT